MPTATSVVSDLVAVMKNMRLGVNGNSFVAPQFERNLKQPSDIYAQQFLRIHVKDQVGSFSKITSAFSERGVSFEKFCSCRSKAMTTSRKSSSSRIIHRKKISVTFCKT